MSADDRFPNEGIMSESYWVDVELSISDESSEWWGWCTYIFWAVRCERSRVPVLSEGSEAESGGQVWLLVNFPSLESVITSSLSVSELLLSVVPECESVLVNERPFEESGSGAVGSV